VTLSRKFEARVLKLTKLDGKKEGTNRLVRGNRGLRKTFFNEISTENVFQTLKKKNQYPNDHLVGPKMFGVGNRGLGFRWAGISPFPYRTKTVNLSLWGTCQNTHIKYIYLT
jgi:hypothetical protein